MKVKSLNHLIICFLSLILISFNSCKKEDQYLEELNEYRVKNNMLVFSSINDYNKLLKRTIEFSHEELVVWESSIGFKSYGRISEDIYFSINPESFLNNEDVFSFVEKNKNYLYLNKDENGEFELEHYLFNNPERYIINKDRMFQINDIVYKVFDRGYAYTNEKNLEKILNIREDELTNDNCVQEIIFKNYNSENNGIKDSENWCGSGEINARSTDGNDRVKLTIWAHQPPAGAYGYSVARGTFSVRPYKRVLGIWYWCERTMKADIKMAIDYLAPRDWQRIYGNVSFYEKAWKLEGEMYESVYFGSTDFDINVHFGSYDCWASSLSVGWDKPAELKCGSLF